MSINKVKSALTAFDLMWETAQTLAQDLGGILCDRQLQAIENLNHYHSQLHTYA
jgi:FtsZ-interacting cell division protein ZipA